MAYLGSKPSSGFITTAKQRITSSTNNYVDLDHSISSLADVIVFVNFVKQDYTNLTLTTSSRITLGGTLVASDIVEIAYLGKAVATQTPSSGTVTNDMLAGSIANSKLANSSITLNGSAVSLGGSASVDNTPAFQAFMTPDQTISASTYTKIVFDTEDYDTDGCYNHTGSTVTLNGISTPSYSFAPNVAGKYLIGASTNSQNPTDFDTFLVSIFKNGTQINRVINSSRHFDSAMTSFIVTANGTSDYFDIQCYSELSGGTTLEGTDSSSRLMWFAGTRIIGV